jgi:hypothetical protein
MLNSCLFDGLWSAIWELDLSFWQLVWMKLIYNLSRKYMVDSENC